jgi:ABC-type branched-subunit amino acid transport system ATPase component
VTGLPPHQLFKKGLLRTFQLAHEFSTLTVLENLMMVPDHQLGESLMSAWFSWGEVKRQEAEIRERAMEVIGFLNWPCGEELAGNLSGGQKKLIELGRTMMVDAKVVLLDEVGAGVNRTLLSEIGDAIVRLNRDRGYTFCMIEHDMDFIGKLCDPVIVMAEGTVLARGLGRRGAQQRGGDRGLSGPRPEEQDAGANAGNGRCQFGGRRLMYLDGGGDDRRLWRRRHSQKLHRRREKGEIAVIVGPNGAGKSTAMKAMLGMLRLRLGKVVLDGKDISKLTPQARVAEGIAFVPQTNNVFTSLSVQENLEMGAYLRATTFPARWSRSSRCSRSSRKSAASRRANCRAASASRSPSVGR